MFTGYGYHGADSLYRVLHEPGNKNKQAPPADTTTLTFNRSLPHKLIGGSVCIVHSQNISVPYFHIQVTQGG